MLTYQKLFALFLAFATLCLWLEGGKWSEFRWIPQGILAITVLAIGLQQWRESKPFDGKKY